MVSNEHLVHGSVIAQKQSGGDLIDVINSDSFKRMPIEQKVDFIHTYANAKAPEPKAATTSERIKSVLGGAAGAGAAGATLGAVSHISKGGTLPMFSPHEMLGKAGPEAMAKVERETNEFLAKLKRPALLGAAVGGVAAYKFMKDKEKDKEYVRNSLRNIRNGHDPEASAAAILFNKEQINKRRSQGFTSSGYSAQLRTLKENLFPFGVK